MTDTDYKTGIEWLLKSAVLGESRKGEGIDNGQPGDAGEIGGVVRNQRETMHESGGSNEEIGYGPAFRVDSVQSPEQDSLVNDRIIDGQQ